MRSILIVLMLSWSGIASIQRPPPDLDGPDYTGIAEWRRNWTRENGSPEHACSRDGQPVGGDETPNWHACNCQHKSCDAINGNEQQAMQAWDARCKAKCSRNHCHCEESCNAT